MNFKVGDVVSLKSGGAKMTVEGGDDKGVACVWNDGKKALRDVFLPETLTDAVTVEEFLAKLDAAETGKSN